MKYILFSILIVSSAIFCSKQKTQQQAADHNAANMDHAAVSDSARTDTSGYVPPSNTVPVPDTVGRDSSAVKNAPPEKMPQSDKTTAKTDTATHKGSVAMSSDKGIGPITSVTLGPIDPKMAEQGKSTFNTTCTACHALDKKMVGPPLRDVTKRRTPEFIMNMLLNTQEMQQKDPEVKQLIKEYKVLMAIPKLTQDQARQLLEYLRQEGEKKK